MGPCKNAQKGYTPKHTKLKDMQGRQVHDRLRSTTLQTITDKNTGQKNGKRGKTYRKNL